MIDLKYIHGNSVEHFSTQASAPGKYMYYTYLVYSDSAVLVVSLIVHCIKGY